ncbi:TPA: peptidase domain-containing ABC transporter [Bacillus pseudomycoides]|nr:peptidase domain-containing ABC transporter [Bacillus pseudomycoides]
MKNSSFDTLKKVPFVEQMEQADCGICCISMITQYYKSYVSLFELQEIVGSGRDGVSLYTLVETARKIGLSANTYKRKWNEFEGIKLPAILHWNKSHYVVLEKITPERYVIIDPAIGRRQIDADIFRTNYSGFIVSLYPNENFIQQKPVNSWKPYLQLLSNHKHFIISLMLWSLLFQICMLLSPIITNYVIDKIIIPNDYHLFNLLIIGVAAVVIFQVLFLYLRSRFLVLLRNNLDWELMNEFFQHIMYLPYQFFQARSFSDLMFRANSNVMIRETLSNQVVNAILDIGLMLIFLGYFLYQSFIMAVFVIVIGVIYILIIQSSVKHLELLSQQELVSKSKVQMQQGEMLYGIFGIKTSGMEEKMLGLWRGLHQRQLESAKRKELFAVKLETIVSGIRFLAPFIILLMGTWQVGKGSMSMGSMIAFYTLTITFFGILSSLVTSYNELVKVSSYLRRMSDVLETPVEDYLNKKVIEEKPKGEIHLENVSFCYSKYSNYVLKDINLCIKPGQKVAIVGKSGSGKSTLASLLMGLYTPTSGNVLFDGLDLSELDKISLRKHIGAVPQHIHLFNRSVYENITMLNSDIDEEKVIQAAKLANIHDDIINMPLGYHTVISEFGTNFSGGQKQRIALARALVNKPAILFLDEATSSLDTINEKHVDNYLSKLNCTRIVIAHRLSTIQNSDLIVVLESGCIVEQGKHDTLIEKKGAYYNLHNVSQEKRGIAATI